MTNSSGIVAEFKRRLCHLYGYDEQLKYVGKTSSAPTMPAASSLKPLDFLSFAMEDSQALEEERNRVNCLANCKRAIDAQADSLISKLGFLAKARKDQWNVPRKLEFIGRAGVVAPGILNRVNQLRNHLEHHFSAPSREQVEDAMDVATLFVSYAQLVQLPSLNLIFSGGLTVKYDYDEMIFHFFEKEPKRDCPDTDRPVHSLRFGDEEFDDFYNFMIHTVPAMGRSARAGKDI